jgi:aspartate aminotransferase
MELSKRAMMVENSPTLALEEKAKSMRAQGLDIVSFTVGEPDFTTPEYICLAAHQAIDDGFTRYTAASGIPELKVAICSKLKKDNGLTVQPSQIVVSNGAKHSIYNACYALLNPGDEVLIVAPYWTSYPEIIKMCDGVPVVVEASEQDAFIPRIEEIVKKITPKTKAIIINTPGNPTGCVYTKEILIEIGQLAIKHNFYIISDEIYEKLIHDDQKHHCVAALLPECKDQTIVINGHSKAYAMTGWRIGYAACPPSIAKIMSNVQSQMTSNPNSIAQKAALSALVEESDFLIEKLAKFKARRDLLVDRINTIQGLSCKRPIGAFYIMINISAVFGSEVDGKKIENSFEFCEALLNVAHVAFVPGGCFGADDYVRLSYAADTKILMEGMRRTEAFLKNIQGTNS